MLLGQKRQEYKVDAKSNTLTALREWAPKKSPGHTELHV